MYSGIREGLDKIRHTHLCIRQTFKVFKGTVVNVAFAPCIYTGTCPNQTETEICGVPRNSNEFKFVFR